MARVRLAISATLTVWAVCLAGCGGEDGAAHGPLGGAGGASVDGGDAQADGSETEAGSEPLALELPGALAVDEDALLTATIGVQGGVVTPRVWLTGLPPGARWDEAVRTLRFVPDFIQGGETWTVQVTATDGVETKVGSFTVEARDTIQPPWPQVVGSDPGTGYTKLSILQGTDEYLDSPGYAGRQLDARVYIPDGADAAHPMPVRVYLHGFGGAPYDGTSSGGQYRIYAHDPMNTYWWGYAEGLPGSSPDHGTVPNYTQRRVLHLLEWVLHTYPGADPGRVYVVGDSMGGAGAMELGLLYARHFAFVDAKIGQAIPRNHRPSRIAQLETLWGSPSLDLQDGTALDELASVGVWDRQDLTRVLEQVPEAREQFVFTKHGKDDPTIHFGAVTQPSPETGVSFYDALRGERIGHYVVWDEGGHGTADPVMPDGWWDDGWSRVFDPTTWLHRDRAFPAFAHASADWDPGDGTGNGKQPWNAETGFAGQQTVAGDTGWTGDLAGARNRFLRWDTNALVDELDRLEIPLVVLQGAGAAAPAAGYPSTGDRLDRPTPVEVDVTMRRVSRFRCLPGESVHWEFGADSGVVQAQADGSITVPQLPLTTSWTVLRMRREEPFAP